jgi:formate hydrogenlyase subunit 4
MSIVLPFVAQVLHILLILAAAPTLAGVTGWLEARLNGQSGPPIPLPWRELIRLSRKTPAMLESTSAVSHVAPAIGFGVTLTAAILVPSFALFTTLSPVADVVVIVSLLALARATTALATLDSGGGRSGLRQQSASALAVIVEPAAMLSVLAVALMAGTLNLDSMIAQQREGMLMPAAASLIALIALGTILVTDTALPDDSLGGIELALALAAGWLRRLTWIDLIGGIFLPVGIASADSGPLAWLIGLGVWLVKLIAIVLALAALSALFGRIPRHSLPGVFGVAALLALLAVIMVLASAGMA